VSSFSGDASAGTVGKPHGGSDQPGLIPFISFSCSFFLASWHHTPLLLWLGYACEKLGRGSIKRRFLRKRSHDQMTAHTIAATINSLGVRPPIGSWRAHGPNVGRKKADDGILYTAYGHGDTARSGSFVRDLR